MEGGKKRNETRSRHWKEEECSHSMLLHWECNVCQIHPAAFPLAGNSQEKQAFVVAVSWWGHSFDSHWEVWGWSSWSPFLLVLQQPFVARGVTVAVSFHHLHFPLKIARLLWQGGEREREKDFSLVTSASLVMVWEFFRRKSSYLGFLRAKFHEVLQTDCVLCYPFAGEGHCFHTNNSILSHSTSWCILNMPLLMNGEKRNYFLSESRWYFDQCLLQQSHSHVIANTEIVFSVFWYNTFLLHNNVAQQLNFQCQCN